VPPNKPPPPPPQPAGFFATSIDFFSADTALMGLFQHGETCEGANRFPFRNGTFEVLIEGAEYRSAWLETQPMAGAMYATRDTRVAYDNQQVFIQTQRSDGLMPGRVDRQPGGRPGDDPDGAAFYYDFLQGLYMASPAVDVAWWLSLAAASGGGSGAPPAVEPYLLELRSALEGYDSWLWTNRNNSGCCGLYSPREGPTASTCCYHNASQPRCCPATTRTAAGLGLLWSPSFADTGEDRSDKYVDNTAPFQTMDLMGYSHDCARALARIARLLSDPVNATRWTERAAAVAAAVKAGLWRAENHAMYDRDSNGEWVTTLVHNNIRCMISS
jgi:hypothetical protein